MKTASTRAPWELGASDASRTASTNAPAAGATAVLFDADRQSRTILEVVLAQRGYTVHACRDRDEFWAFLDGCERPIIALGLSPRTPGDQAFLQRVVAIAAERGLPVLVVGATDDERQLARPLPPLLTSLPRPIPVAALRSALTAFESQATAAQSDATQAQLEPADVYQDQPAPGATATQVGILGRGVDLTAELDSELRIRRVGLNLQTTASAPEHRLIGRDFGELVHPDEREQLRAEVQALDMDARNFRARLLLEEPDGAPREFSLRFTRLSGIPEIPGYLVMGIQTPTHATVDAELKRMREHLSSFVETAPLAVFSFDDALRISSWSDSARMHLGWEPDDLVGRAPDDWVFIESAQRAAVAERIRSIATDKRTRFVFMTPARTRDGATLEIEWYCSVHRAPGGDLRSATCMGLDVSEQRQAQEVLRESEERFKALVQHASDIIVIIDEDATMQYVSPAAERVLGYQVGELISQSALALIHPDDLPQAMERLNVLLRTPGEALEPEELRFRHVDGGWRYLELRAVNLLALPSVNGIVLNVRDISEQRITEEILRRSEERFRSLVQHSSDMLMVLDAAGNVTYVSPAAEKLLGAPSATRLGQYAFDGVHPEDADAARALLERALDAPGAALAGEFRLSGRDGEWRSLECRVRNLLSEPSVRGIVVNGRDVTERRVAEEASRESEERFRSLVQNASDMVTVVDADWRISYQSPSIERILGYVPDEVVERRLTEFIHPDDEARARNQLKQVLKSERATVRFELRWRHSNDTYRQIEVVCTNLLGDSSVCGIVINARDVTDRKALERQLTRRAFLDSLTNLPNRLLFMHRLDRALQRASGASSSVGVLFLDLDRFKIVNDSLGHEIGDQLLIAVAQRLRRIIRPADTVARLGGDEFIVLIEGAQNVAEVIRVAERIIEELNTPIRLNRHEVAVAASIGIALGDGPSVTSQDLLRNADIALYRAKEQGTGSYVVFDASMARQAVQRLALESELRRAVQRNEFRVHYLPEIDLSTGRLAGLEVLVRWAHPERGLVRPAEFMEVAEETGLIVPIGEWALQRACEQARAWQDAIADADDLFLAINLTAREFQRPDLVDYITGVVKSNGLRPNALRLEISESIMVAEPLSSLEKLRRLKERGVMLAIDDFGSGYSSLSYLTRVSFDTLKIDRQFVSGPGGVTNNLSIVRAVTSLAHALGMNVTAEGVESPEHLTRVRAAGCDHGQGFLFSDALDADSVEALLFAQPNDEMSLS